MLLPPQAIILAAGRGRRLGALTRTRPKCLLRVGARTLLEHQLAALAQHGIARVAVVIGYGADQVRQVGGSQAEYIVNPRSTLTNSLYSLWLARHLTDQGFLLLNADVLFHPELLTRLLASPYPDALTVERGQEFDDEQMKVQLDGERVVALSKQLDAGRAHAENVGVVKFSAVGARTLLAKMKELLAAGAEREFCPFAFSALAPHYPLHAVIINGIPWIEIDFVADLRRARQEVLPSILARDFGSAPLRPASKLANRPTPGMEP